MNKLSKIYIFLLLLFMYAPLFSIIVFSFTDNNVFGVWDGFSLQLYKNLFSGTVEELSEALVNTLLITFTVSALSTILGTTAAIGHHNSHNGLYRGIVATATNIDIAMPDIIIAVSLILTFVTLGVTRGMTTIILGQIVLCVPFAFFCVLPALQSMDQHTYEAAADMGANWWQTLWYVILPQIRMSIASAFFICVGYSLDDYIITIFCNGSENLTTLATFIYSDASRGGLTPEIRPFYALFFLIVLVALVIYNMINTAKKKNMKKAAARKSGKMAIALLLFFGFSLQASAANDRSHILKVTHFAECIDDHMIESFEKWYKKQTGEEIHVMYKPFDNDLVALNTMVLASEDWDVIYACNDNVASYIKTGLFLPIDMSVLAKTHTPDYTKNISAYVQQRLKEMIPGVDLNMYCKPVSLSLCGIMYDASLYKPQDFDSWDFLLNPALKNQIMLPSTPSDLYSLGLCSLYEKQIHEGKLSPVDLYKKIDLKYIPEIEQRIKECKKNMAGWIVDPNYESFMQKNFTVMPIYTENICALVDELKEHNVAVHFPTTCGFWSMIHMLTPRYAKNKKAAAYWISYMCSAEMASHMYDEIGFVIPPVDSREFFDNICDAESNPETVDISYMFPSIPEAKHAHVSQFVYPDRKVLDKYFFFRTTRQVTDEISKMNARLQTNEPEWLQFAIELIVFLAIAAWAMMIVIKRNRSLSRLKKIQLKKQAEEAERQEEEEKRRVTLLDAARKTIGRDDINPDDDLLRLGMNTQRAVAMAFLAQEEGVFIKTSDIMRWRSVNAMTKGKMSLGWWVNAYSSERPVLLAVFGNRTIEEWMPELHSLCNSYSIFALEPVDELMDNVFIDASVEDMAMLYKASVETEVPQNVKISKIVTGDKLAEDIAAKMNIVCG